VFDPSSFCIELFLLYFLNVFCIAVLFTQTRSLFLYKKNMLSLTYLLVEYHQSIFLQVDIAILCSIFHHILSDTNKLGLGIWCINEYYWCLIKSVGSEAHYFSNLVLILSDWFEGTIIKSPSFSFCYVTIRQTFLKQISSGAIEFESAFRTSIHELLNRLMVWESSLWTVILIISSSFVVIVIVFVGFPFIFFLFLYTDLFEV
jgi:hypothetical protein